MFVRTLYRLGLTDLTPIEVNRYEAALRSGVKFEERWKVKLWGFISLFLCSMLLAFAAGMTPMFKTIHTISELQAKSSAVDQQASFKPIYVMRGGGDEADPAETLRRVRARVPQINRELNSLSLQSIDYSSLAKQRTKLTLLNRELARLSAETALARKKLGAES